MRSLLGRIPIGMLIASTLLAGIGLATRRSAPQSPDRVTRAINAPFADVGILPVESSIAFWRSRVDAGPSDYLSRTRLATALMTQAKETGGLALYAEAEQVLRGALALNPSDDASLLALAAARAANHDFAGAIELADKVVAAHPDSRAAESARVAIADANFELGNYDVARRQTDELLAVLPAGPGTATRLAKRAAVEGRLDDAVEASAAATIAASDLDLRPAEAAFYRFQLGHFLARAGRFAEALRALDAGLAIDHKHLPSLEAKAHVLVSLGRLRDARALYERLVARTPAADLYGELAKVYRALGRTTDADAMVAQGLALGHEQISLYPAERRHLASFFAEYEPATALELAKADFETRRDVGAYDTLAWAFFRNGLYDDALRYVDDALAQGTRDAALLYHAGMIEQAAGHSHRAARLLREALELDPRFDLVHAPQAKAAVEGLS
jgi:tetratricopeptide (TPR) repeat protein